MSLGSFDFPSRFETLLPGVARLSSCSDGPHLGIIALIHGNEPCGVHALQRLLSRDLELLCGSLTVILANLDAYPTARFIDEDLNRLWSDELPTGPVSSHERKRARALAPAIADIDHLLDLHSMTLPAPPLWLTGTQRKSIALAERLGLGHALVIDHGHEAGRRLRDFGAFDDPRSHRSALLLECGQHEDPASVEIAYAACRRFLGHFGLIDCEMPTAPAGAVIEVTEAVTVRDPSFAFVQPWEGLARVSRAGTPIATEAGRTILAPHDDCILVMPARRLTVGHTAVRFGRQVR